MVPSAYVATYVAIFATLYGLVLFTAVTGLGESLILIKNPTAERNFWIFINVINKVFLASIPLYKRYRLQKQVPATPKTGRAIA